jgi:hypothetical protein
MLCLYVLVYARVQYWCRVWIIYSYLTILKYRYIIFLVSCQVSWLLRNGSIRPPSKNNCPFVLWGKNVSLDWRCFRIVCLWRRTNRTYIMRSFIISTRHLLLLGWLIKEPGMDGTCSMVALRNVGLYKILVGRSQGQRLHERFKRSWEKSIKIDPREIGSESVDWIKSSGIQARSLPVVYRKIFSCLIMTLYY